MLVFWKQRLVVLSMPKTGTTSLEAALEPIAAFAISRPPNLKHTPAYRYQRFFRPYLQSAAQGEAFTAVALMREPVDWLGSWYRYRARAHLDDTPRSTRDMSFADFVRAYMQTPRPEFAAVGGQAQFLSGIDGAALGVDRVFRYEQIGRFVSFLEERLDFAIELPWLNASPGGPVDLPADLAAELRAALDPEYRIYDAIA